MLRAVGALVLIVFLSWPAARAEEIAELNSRCSTMPAGPIEVDGSRASDAEMRAMRDEVQSFVNAAQDYITCVTLYADSDKKTLTAPEKQKLLKIVAQVADEKEEVGCTFQKQLDLYNRKHDLVPVEFDEICVARFARGAEGGK